MVLNKQKIDLSIMESTDQITSSKMSIRPSEIINLRYTKAKEAKKRTGLNRYSGISTTKAVAELNGSGYLYTTSGVYGINDIEENTAQITSTPINTWGIEKLRQFSSNGVIDAVAIARGENYFFAAYHVPQNSTGNPATYAYLLDDNFNVIKELTDLPTDAREIRAVSYDVGGVRYVDFLYINSLQVLRVLIYDENGDVVNHYNRYSLSLVSSYGSIALSEAPDGDGYWVAVNDYSTAADRLRVANYKASTDTWTTFVSAAITGLDTNTVPLSVAVFSDKLIVTTGQNADPTGSYGTGLLLSIDITSFPSSMPVTLVTYAVSGLYCNNLIATRIDDTYYYLTLNEWKTTSGSGEAASMDLRILRAIKTSTNISSSGYVKIERTSSIGKAIIASGQAYQMVMCQNGYYPTYYFIRTAAAAGSTTKVYTLNHFLPARATIYKGYYYNANTLTGANPYDCNYYQGLMVCQPGFIEHGGKYYSYVPVQSIGEYNASWQVLSFSNDVPVKTAGAEGLSVIASGSLSIFDGVELLNGIARYPEILEVTAGAAGAGSYAWIAVIKRTDGAGNIVRSLTSPPVVRSSVAAIVGITGGTHFDLDLAGKAQLWEDGGTASFFSHTESVYEIYRTELNGDIFYKIGESLGSVFHDDIEDSLIIDNELLYTTGGTLENVYPAAVYDMTYANGRVWTIGNDDVVSYSKEPFTGTSLEFNDGLQYKISGGKNTSIARSGKRVIVFKQRQTFLLWGSPANNIGTGEALDHQEISSSIGAVSAVATVETEVGVIFESEKGLYIVKSNNSVEFIGADVIDYTTNASITSSTHIEDLNEAVFTLSDGKVLVYNYLFGIWQVMENGLGVSFIASGRIGNRDLYVDSSGFIYKAKLPGDANPYQDETTNFKVRYSTGWLKVSEIGGFQRCYRLYVLGGKATTAQDIIVKVYNDYDDTTPTQTKTFAIAAGDPLNFELHVKQQKCESIRFTIEEDTNVDNGYIELNGLSIQVGVKRGFNKLSPDLRR